MLSNNDINIIVKGCIDCNRVSQKDFYKNFYGYAAAICNRYVANEYDLVEVVNDGFLKIFKEIERFDVNVNHLESRLMSWIKSIMIHTSIDFYRKQMRDNISINIVANENLVDNVSYDAETPIDKLTYYEIIELTNQLTPMYKLVFNMSVIDGMSHDEIAKKLNISEGTSKSNLYKARQIIIKLIEKKYKQVV